MSDALERRLVDLEARIAFHERMAEEMSGVLYDQGKLIDRMGQQIQRLKARLLEVEEGRSVVPPNERPPHY